MAQKRREEYMRQVRNDAKKRRKPKAPYDVFYCTLFSEWNRVACAPQQEDQPLEHKIKARGETFRRVPAQFASAAEYFSTFKPLVVHEALTCVARRSLQVLRHGHGVRRGAAEATVVDIDPCSGYHGAQGAAALRVMTLSLHRNGEHMFDHSQTGTVFALLAATAAGPGPKKPLLATFARVDNSLVRERDGLVTVRMLALPGTSDMHRGPWQVVALDCVVSLQRSYEALHRSPSPPFLPFILMGRINTHVKFDEDDDEEEEGEQDDVETTEAEDEAATGGLRASPAPRGGHGRGSDLNPSQRRALGSFRDMDSGLVLVQGPPGTGKTTFLVRAILEAVRMEQQILVTAPTNKATVLLLQRTLQCLGSSRNSPAIALMGVHEKICELLPQLNDAHDALHSQHHHHHHHHHQVSGDGDGGDADTTATSVAAAVDDRCADCFAHMVLHRAHLHVHSSLRAHGPSALETMRCVSCQQGLLQRRAPHSFRAYLKEAFDANAMGIPTDELLAEMRRCARDPSIVDSFASEFISTASVVFSTVASAANVQLKVRQSFNAVVIDEAAQVVEADMGVLLMVKPRKMLICGDPMQLPATVMSANTSHTLFHRSLMERLMVNCGFPFSMLDVQYRMHPRISAFPNRTFYANKLQDAASTRTHKPFGAVCDRHWYQRPFVFVRCEGRESQNSESSTRNDREADLVCELAAYLARHEHEHDCRRECQPVHGPGSTSAEPGGLVVVISLYSAQVQRLRGLVRQHVRDGDAHLGRVRVHTVDSFQGSEADTVIVSMVRSNAGGYVGFASERRRLNVALTRAKRRLVVVGSADTLSHARAGEHLNALVRHARDTDSVVEEAAVRASLRVPPTIVVVGEEEEEEEEEDRAEVNDVHQDAHRSDGDTEMDAHSHARPVESEWERIDPEPGVQQTAAAAARQGTASPRRRRPQPECSGTLWPSHGETGTGADSAASAQRLSAIGRAVQRCRWEALGHRRHNPTAKLRAHLRLGALLLSPSPSPW